MVCVFPFVSTRNSVLFRTSGCGLITLEVVHNNIQQHGQVGEDGGAQRPHGAVGGAVDQESRERNGAHLRGDKREQNKIIEPVYDDTGQEITEMQVCQEAYKSGNHICKDYKQDLQAAL